MNEIFLPSFSIKIHSHLPPKMRLYVVQAEPITIIMGSPEMFIGMYDLNNELIKEWKLNQF